MIYKYPVNKDEITITLEVGEQVKEQFADAINEAYDKGYNKAIDDLMNQVCETDMSDRDWCFLKKEAERLKGEKE